MAAPNTDVMHGSIPASIPHNSAIQQIHQLSSNLIDQQQHSIPNHHIQQLQNLTQQSPAISVHHPHSQYSHNAIHHYHRMQQSTGQHISSSLHQPDQILHQQHQVSPYSGNINNLMFASTENASAASGETDSAGSSAATATAGDINNVVVNLASVSQPSSVASANSNRIASRINSTVGHSHIPEENVQNCNLDFAAGSGNIINLAQFNVAPGWRRIKYNSEIIYISPSGVPLRNFNQVKDYLLTGGTCKCGLPCPFRPEVIFEFNTQVPNSSLDGNSNVAHNFCLHHSRYMEQIALVRYEKKMIDKENVTKSVNLGVPSIPGETEHIFSSNIQSGQKFVGSDSSDTINDEIMISSQSKQHERDIKSIPLSKTPPWRKHPSAISSSSTIPLLSSQHEVQCSSNLVPAKTSVQNVSQNEQLVKNIRVSNGNPNSSTLCTPFDTDKLKSPNKKRPNFKDDPTGYLNQQTAILHSSISTLHSPDGSSSSQESPQLKSVGRSFSNETSESIESTDQNCTVMTAISGQTVTHMANGIIQVQQNCDISHMKLQQQLQFQHQLQRQNQLVRQHNEQLQFFQQHQQITGEKDSIQGSVRFVTVAEISPIQPSSAKFTTSRTPDVTSTSPSTPDLKDGPNCSPLLQINSSGIRSASPEVYSAKNLVPISSFSSSSHKSQASRGTSVALASISSAPRNTITSVQASSRPVTVTSTHPGKVGKSVVREHEYDSPSVSLGSRYVKPEKVSLQNTATGIVTQNLLNFNNQQTSQTISQPQQVLMTSSGQILVMSSNSNKYSNQIVAGNNLNNNSVSSALAQNVLIPQQTIVTGGNGTQYLSMAGAPTGTTAPGSSTLNEVTGNQFVTNNNGHSQNLGQQQANIIHHTQSNANPSFLINSPSNIQSTVILNNGNLIQSSGGQPLLTSNNPQVIHNPAASGTNIGSKVIQGGANSGIISNQSSVSQLISPNSQPGGTAGVSPQQVVLNSLPPNSIVIQQPNYTSITGDTIVNQDGSTTSYIQNQQRQVLISPDSKRRPKKPKSNGSSSTGQIISQNNILYQPQTGHVILSQQQHQQPQQPQQQSHAIQPVNQCGTMLQLAPQYQTQGYQLNPGISGLTIVPQKTAQQTPQQQQQILLQNGQIITQPYNIISQQVLLPTGFVMAPDTTLVQIQNVASPCGGIITTPQGMLIRAQSPHQQKSFLSPSTSQQYIMNNNGQVSPMGPHLYGGSVNIMVPQQQQAGPATSFVQQNASLVQQPSQHIVQQQSIQMTANLNTSTDSNSTASSTHEGSSLPPTPQPQAMTQKNHSVYLSGTASPPDTTTHSPNSPDCASSEKSVGSADNGNVAMVQCVSSSEPDIITEGTHSPTDIIEYIEQESISPYRRTVYKSTKTRRMQLQPQSTQIGAVGDSSDNGNDASSSNPSKTISYPNQIALQCQQSSRHHNISQQRLLSHGAITTRSIQPDSHESTTKIAVHESAAGTSHRTVTSPIVQSGNGPSSSSKTFNIGELVWGAVRCFPAWPGKIIEPPPGDGQTTKVPVDSVWVRWFGGRPLAELVVVNGLKSLSDGLEAHHRAQKDARKGRKLNPQLERAIQEAMMELDRVTATPCPTIFADSATAEDSVQSKSDTARASPTSSNVIITPGGSTSMSSCSNRTVRTNRGPKVRLVKIAPAPPTTIEISSTSTNVTITNNSSVSRNKMK
ncbi:uncharacterized protein LOC129717834 isoform X2 [Wyeomyia smithii]|uniref:uncharacterized protein LOC129717834 isoform X2 n=1 Tax=Wyeomyia smithii TaxID=174621 RepID=UPI0024680CCD|nr:uncharacterized protein LOC129717834 isoform X2 [Wyeomyia smithii]